MKALLTSIHNYFEGLREAKERELGRIEEEESYNGYYNSYEYTV